MILRGGAIERPEIEIAHDVRIGEQRVVAFHVIRSERANDETIRGEWIDQSHQTPLLRDSL